MQELPKYYTILFNAVTDAIADMEGKNYGKALDLLIQGQRKAEEAYTDKPGEEAPRLIRS